jgi:hypothetical protein
LKIHIAVNIKSKKIISIKVTAEHVHDGKVLPKLVDDIATSKKDITLVGKVFADNAYDSNAVFECLVDNGILPCIKVIRNARVKRTNHFLRNLSVISQKNNLQEWKDSVSYGQRLIAETVFSCREHLENMFIR